MNRCRYQEQNCYQAEPLHRSIDEDKGRGKLYAEYKRGIDERKTRLKVVKEREDAALAAIRAEMGSQTQGN
jgi:hypothetical protein